MPTMLRRLPNGAGGAGRSTSVVTLPLFGSWLVADVTTDAGGGLVDVTLTPAEGYDPAKVRPNKVAFVNEAQGVVVKVTARHGGERVEARLACWPTSAVPADGRVTCSTPA